MKNKGGEPLLAMMFDFFGLFVWLALVSVWTLGQWLAGLVRRAIGGISKG